MTGHNCRERGHVFELVSLSTSRLLYYVCAHCEACTWREKDSLMTVISVPPKDYLVPHPGRIREAGR
jgi:hypothetical protein